MWLYQYDSAPNGRATISIMLNDGTLIAESAPISDGVALRNAYTKVIEAARVHVAWYTANVAGYDTDPKGALERHVLAAQSVEVRRSRRGYTPRKAV